MAGSCLDGSNEPNTGGEWTTKRPGIVLEVSLNKRVGVTFLEKYRL